MNFEYKNPETDAEKAQLDKEINDTHAEALHSAKLGKALVKKTIKLIESGKSERTFISPRLSSKRADETSTTFALNAELKSMNIDATAKVSRKWDGSVGDPGFSNVLSLSETESKETIPPKD